MTGQTEKSTMTAKYWLTVLSDSSTIGPRSRPSSSLLQCRCRFAELFSNVNRKLYYTKLYCTMRHCTISIGGLGLVVVSSMFPVTSSRLVCSALRLLSTLAESTVMFRAFSLLSVTARAIIPRCSTCVDKDSRSHPLCDVSWFSYSLRSWSLHT